MSESLSVSVIGPGALGIAMIDLILKHSDFSLFSVWGRTASDSYFVSPSGQKDRPDHEFPMTDKDIGRLTLVTVPDDQISELATHLSETQISWGNRIVIHLSGSLDQSVLEPLSDRGADIGSLHPLQTFTRNDLADRFDGIWFSMQGTDRVLTILKKLIEPCGGQAKVLTSSQKSAMHLAAVFASNYLVSLMDVVNTITEKNNIDDGLQMLEPIVHQTFKNIISKGPKNSLSGPIARGDITTIKKHLDLMDQNSDEYRLYCRMGLIAADIAKSSGQLDEKRSEEIREFISSRLHSDE